MAQVTKDVKLLIRRPCSAWVLAGKNFVEETKEEKKTLRRFLKERIKPSQWKMGSGLSRSASELHGSKDICTVTQGKLSLV